MNHKQVNKLIASILGDPQEYDLRYQFQTMEGFESLSLEAAQAELDKVPETEKHLYSITSTAPNNYCDDMNLALFAARRIAERNQQTFVLSLEDGTWKAAYGDWGQCAEYVGSNPAYCSCMAVLKYMGKV